MPSYYDPNITTESKQRRAYAKRLMEQSQQPQGTEYVGNVAVAQSPIAALARSIQGGIGQYQETKADSLDQQAMMQKQQALSDAVAKMGADPQAAAGILAQNPETADAGFKLYGDAINRQAEAAMEDQKYQREMMRDDRRFDNQRKLQLMRMGSSEPYVGPDGEVVMPQQKAPSGYRYNTQGNLEAIPGGPGDKTMQPMNEYQGKAALFADRLANSDQLINRLGSVGADPKQAAKASVPLIGNYLVSDDYQQYEQSKRDFLNAILRQESGAAIGKNEFESGEKQYFPQPGDSPETIKQKAKNRQIATQRMAKLAGPAYQSSAVDGQPQGEVIGTSGGKRVFRLPDGTHVMEQ